MKATKLLLIAGTVMIGMAGCIPTSIHPLYNERDLLFEPALLGIWSEKVDSKENWRFEKAGEKEYRVVITDADGKTGEFQAHLLKLGGTLFLDLFPDGCGVGEAGNCNGYYQMHLQPMHSFLKVPQLEPALQLAPMSLKWLGGLLKADPTAIRHEKIGPEKEDQQIVLTASTPDLQAFILKYLKTPDAFGDEPMTLKRVESKP